MAMTGAHQAAAREMPAGTQAGASPAPAPVEVRTSLSRTAMWVGDQVVYTVALQCAPGVDVLLDDLLKERIRIDGGEILNAETARREDGGRITHTVSYTLGTYRVDVPAVTVSPQSVRYYVRGGGQRPGDAAPAGEVIIPQLVVAVRSTIPDSDRAIELRPPAEVRLAPRFLRLAQPLGLALILIAIVPAAILSLGLARRLRGIRRAYDSRRSRRLQGGSFAEIKALQPSSDSQRIEAFGKLDALVRDHLQLTTGIEARALTPAVMRKILETRAPRAAHERIEAVLAACER